MIKANNGDVTVNGTKSKIQTDLSMIIRALHYEEILTKKEIQECFDMGFKTEKEISELFDEKLNRFLDKLFN